MRGLFLVFFLWVAFLQGLRAQILESFTDGDFTQNPVWAGDTDFFQVNAARQLQSKGPAVTGTTLHLSTPNQLAVGAQWEFYMQLGFATSSGNYAEVHLISDGPDLKGAQRGYFVRLGGTEDEVSLFRKDGTTASKIINGADGTLGTTDNKVWVRVTRTGTTDWRLELDLSGTRQQYQLQGTAQDARYTTSAYAGILFRYSQANAQRLFFDDFSVVDVGVPDLLSVLATGPRTLEVTFSEAVQEADATNRSNYVLNGQIAPATVEWSASSPQRVRLQFAQDFETGANQIEVQRVVDTDGNEAQNLKGTFLYAPIAQPGEVRITEIYADINPLQDLPGAEFFEIHNRSNKTFNLQGWQYSDATTNTGTFPAYLLRPGEYLIVCAAADTALFRAYGPVIGLATFPSLNDSSDDLELYNASGLLIDMVRFTSAWYRDVVKREGGWTLELMDVATRCTGPSQWKASENVKGGTPGQPNSLQLVDQTPPVLTQVIALAPDRILLQFNEPLDSAQAVGVSHYTIAGGIVVQGAKVLPLGLTEVELTLATPLKENERYTVTVTGVQNCAGNVASAAQTGTVILPGSPQAGEVVINEILFNPRSGGVDFVEIVNRSSKYLNLQGWKVANRADGLVASARVISTQSLLLAPGEYLVLTANSTILANEYPMAKQERFFGMASLPSYPDDAGHVVLLLPNDSIMDEVSYQSSQHFRLISDPEGISLERILLTGPSTPANFHSAATTIKATPGYQNSQVQLSTASRSTLIMSPKTFTPDGDGIDDALLLQFNLPQAGYVATVTIYDAQGRRVRKLVSNTLLGTESVLQWDGLTDAGAKAAIGYYIVLVELFHLQGQKEAIKETVVVGGRF